MYQQFVGRKQWVDRFNDYMHPDEGLIWRITGVPGIGKSTLMRKFAQRCEEAGRMHVFLDIEGLQAGHGLDILSELSKSARYFDTENSNKSLLEAASERLMQYKDGLGSVLEAGKLVDPSGGLISGGAKVLLDLGSGLAGSAANMSEEAAAVHPELFLLNALAAAADGDKKPICLVDTFEHALAGNLKLQSRLDFGFAEPRESTLKTQPLAAWLLSLFEFLWSKGWRVVIAGRNMKGAAVKDQLNRFTRDEIAHAASQRPGLRPYMTDQADAIVDVLATLSFEGNPLWLQVAMNLLEGLLAQGEDLEALAKKPDYLHQCFEEEDPFASGEDYGIEGGQCKLQLIGTLTRHIEGLEDQAWKIALPRVLDKGIVGQLFEADQARVVLHNFEVAGVFRHNGKQFRLHEEIRDLLLAYARSKGWLELEETWEIHGRLWEYLNGLYQDREEYPVIWQLEATYHRLYSLLDTLGHLDDSAAFVVNLMGSAYLPNKFKHRIAGLISESPVSKVKKWEKILVEEQEKLESLVGMNAKEQLLKDLSSGKAESIGDISYWEERTKIGNDIGNYSALVRILSLPEKSPVHLVDVVDRMLEIYGSTTDLLEQEECAKALLSKCAILKDRCNDPNASIATYDDLLCRYEGIGHPVIQILCASALFNKSLTLANNFNDPTTSVAIFDDLFFRYENIEDPRLEEICAKALFNKGITLSKELDDPEAAIATYDSLLQRYLNNGFLPVQEQCAKALFNKGATLDHELNDPEAAMTTYFQLVFRYMEVEHAPISELCSEAFEQGNNIRLKVSDKALPDNLST